jgi:hypothetical protein
MTLEELLARESIRQTMANYTMAGDRLRADDFVAAHRKVRLDWRSPQSLFTSVIARSRR